MPTRHNERCRNCKTTILALLQRIYGAATEADAAWFREFIDSRLPLRMRDGNHALP